MFVCSLPPFDTVDGGGVPEGNGRGTGGGRRHCSPDCFEAGEAVQRLHPLIAAPLHPHPRHKTMQKVTLGDRNKPAGLHQETAEETCSCQSLSENLQPREK